MLRWALTNFPTFALLNKSGMTRKEIDEELKKVQSLLKQEKEEEFAQFKAKMSNSSYNELRKQGLCWYPVKIEKTSFDSGERLIIRISRPKEHKDSHQFQSGKPVSLFCNAATVEEEDYAYGVINQVKEQEMLITLNSDELPEWIDDGQLGVQLLFDEVSYREMEQTMDFLLKTEDKRLNELKSVLLGNSEANFNTEGLQDNISTLNKKQNEALELVVRALDAAIIHGPPGTGKTTTIVEAIIQVLKEVEQINLD
jgi:flagellar biosynthesis GTPase FlhF